MGWGSVESDPTNYTGELTEFGTLFGTSVLDSLAGISGPVPVGHISTQRRNGRVVGYSAYLGVDGDLRRQRRFFRDRQDAERFLDQKNKTPLPVGELWDRKAEILYNLERLRPLRTDLTDVVTSFV